jgi:hypothetical protein
MHQHDTTQLAPNRLHGAQLQQQQPPQPPQARLATATGDGDAASGAATPLPLNKPARFSATLVPDNKYVRGPSHSLSLTPFALRCSSLVFAKSFLFVF